MEKQIKDNVFRIIQQHQKTLANAFLSASSKHQNCLAIYD